MAAQTRVIQQAQDLGALRDLVDLVKNPKAIIDAHEEARKQMALTEAEQVKLDAAHELIKQANSIKKEFENRENVLQARKKEQEQAESDFSLVAENTRTALKAKEDAQRVKDSGHAETDKRHKAEREKLDSDKKSHEETIKRDQENIQKQTNQNQKDKESNDSYLNRLVLREAKLQEKEDYLKKALAV